MEEESSEGEVPPNLPNQERLRSTKGVRGIGGDPGWVSEEGSQHERARELRGGVKREREERRKRTL